MRVKLADMTDHERFVLTRKQLFIFINNCEVRLGGFVGNRLEASIVSPTAIEVEEVLENDRD